MTTTFAVPPVAVLNLRDIEPRQRHATVFSHFDALATGQSMQLQNDHNPEPLRFQFEDRVGGQFDWALLEADPAVWRVQISRIKDAATPDSRAAAGSCCSGGACCG